MSDPYISHISGVRFPSFHHDNHRIQIMPNTRSTTTVQRKSLSPEMFMSDDTLMSLFKRTTAAEQRKNEGKYAPEHKGTQEIELESIMILINYINGQVNICNRPNCGREITLEEALLRRVACYPHRSTAAISQKIRRNVVDKPKRRPGRPKGIDVRGIYKVMCSLSNKYFRTTLRSTYPISKPR